MATPPEPADQQLLDLVVATLKTIGTPATDWLTYPEVAEGSPTDALDESKDLQVFVDHYTTTNTDPQTGTYRAHGWTTRFRIWIAAKATTDKETRGRKTLRRAAADIWRALEAAEGAFDDLSQDDGSQLGPYVIRRDLEAAGFAFASIDFDVQRSQQHGAT